MILAKKKPSAAAAALGLMILLVAVLTYAFRMVAHEGSYCELTNTIKDAAVAGGALILAGFMRAESLGVEFPNLFNLFAMGSSEDPPMPEVPIKSKLPIEIVVENDARHHTSVRKPRTRAHRWASMSSNNVGAGRPHAWDQVREKETSGRIYFHHRVKNSTGLSLRRAPGWGQPQVRNSILSTLLALRHCAKFTRDS